MTNDMSPQVSILLPTYKDAQAIARAIKSFIAQTYTSWELLIIDDGLTDAARQAIVDISGTDTRITLLPYEGNGGIQKALNKGLRIARGMYIARIDDDDEWTDNDKLQKQVNHFEQHVDCVLVGTNAMLRDENGKKLASYTLPQTDYEIRERLLFKNCFLHPTIMFRKNIVDQLGGYDESEAVKHVEDYALWLAMGSKGTVANLAEVTTELTIHSKSLTFQNRIIQAKRVRALIAQYRTRYPHFVMARFVLGLRIAGFTVLQYIPIPQKILYWIQKTYKEF